MLELKYWFDDELYEYNVEIPEVTKVLSQEIVKEMQEDARRKNREINITTEQVKEMLDFLHNRCDIDVCEIAENYQDELLEAFEAKAEAEWDEDRRIGDPIPSHWKGGRF